jgi:NADH-quinone oxidoreductase subunit H
MFIAFFIASLAETNRHPFDLPEAEAELVSGYNVEYSAMGFALFFLAEYANMLLISGLIVVLFFGGWLNPFDLNLIPGCLCFSLKLSVFVVAFIWARAALPRYRYDQLMLLGWKIFLPFSLAWLVFTITLLVLFDFLPNMVQC